MWCRWCIVLYRINMFTSYHYVANSLWHQVKHSLHNVTTSKHSVLLYTYNPHIYIYTYILLSQTLGAACLICLLISMISLIHMCMYIYIFTILYTDININFEGFYFRRFRALFVSDYSVVCFILNGQTSCTNWHTKNPHCNFSTIHYWKFSMNCPSLGIAVSTKRCLLWNKLLAEKIRPLGYNILFTSPDKFCLIHPNDKHLTAEWFNEAARTRDTGLQLRSGLPVRWKWLTRPNQWGDGVEKLFLGNLFEIVCTFEVQLYVCTYICSCNTFRDESNRNKYGADVVLTKPFLLMQRLAYIEILIFLRGRACTPRRFRKVIFPTSQLPF